MATKAKKKPSSGERKIGKLKELELRSRAPPLRGEEAEPKIVARHASAEQAHALHIEAKTFTAKQTTAKAERASQNRDAKIRQTKEKTEAITAAAAERRESEIARVRGKGHAEGTPTASPPNQGTFLRLAPALTPPPRLAPPLRARVAPPPMTEQIRVGSAGEEARTGRDMSPPSWTGRGRGTHSCGRPSCTSGLMTTPT